MATPKKPIPETVSDDEVWALYRKAEGLRAEADRVQAAYEEGGGTREDWIAASDAWHRALRDVVAAARLAGDPRPTRWAYRYLIATDDPDHQTRDYEL